MSGVVAPRTDTKIDSVFSCVGRKCHGESKVKMNILIGHWRGWGG
jgi:hypothetical protein